MLTSLFRQALVSAMTMCMTNSYSPLCLTSPTTSRLSQFTLPKSLPISLKAVRKSSGALFTSCCSNSDSAKDLTNDKETPIKLRYEAFPAVMDVHKIREILPHRFPFLLVDRVVEAIAGGVSTVGIKNFTVNENFFSGHFPDKPIVPGVIIIEAMAQVGGLIPKLRCYKSIYFVGIDKLRIKKQVSAGDTMVMRMTIIKVQKQLGVAKLDGKAYVGGELVVEGEFLMYVSLDNY